MQLQRHTSSCGQEQSMTWHIMAVGRYLPYVFQEMRDGGTDPQTGLEKTYSEVGDCLCSKGYFREARANMLLSKVGLALRDQWSRHK